VTVKLNGFLASGSLLLVLAAPAVAETPTPEAIQELYKTKCQACHLADGNAPQKEMNFTDGEWLHGSKVADIVKVITDGVPGKAMLPFAGQLTPEEIDGLARFVRAFDKKLKPEPAPAKGKK
jgi:cytochrome c oxidase cbb3-type subunit III